MTEGVPFSDLIIRPQWGGRLKPLSRTPVRGLDTESIDGYAFLIVDDAGRSLRLNQGDGEKILKFLFNKRYQGAFNFFYNLRADVTFLVKHFGEEFCRELYEQGEAKACGYTVKYIDSKMLQVKRGKNVATFFDIYQYYRTSLARAAELYLTERKQDVDASEFTYDLIERDFEQIKSYAIQDARLCQQLAKRYYESLKKKIGLKVQNFISSGNLSMQYFRQNVFAWPVLNVGVSIEREALEYAYRSYRGGWFEAYRLGYFEKVWQYDINSAYPAEIKKLVNISPLTGIWVKGKEPPQEVLYGFVRCEVDLIERDLFPLAIKYRGVNCYPFGHFSETYLTLDEARYLGDRCKVLDGWYFLKSSLLDHDIRYQPFAELIDRLYRWKREASDPIERLNVKLLLNSLYGKFWEKTRYPDGRVVTGKIWNPVYASYVTAGTRLRILELIDRYDLAEHLIDVSTDSVTLDCPIPENSSELGGWQEVASGEPWLNIMSGMSEFPRENKIKFRSFRPVRQKVDHGDGTVTEESFSYFRALAEHPESRFLSIVNKQMWTLGDVFQKTKRLKFSDMGKFEDVVKSFRFDAQVKREYFLPSPCTAQCLLEANYSSSRHALEMLEIGKIGRGRGRRYEEIDENRFPYLAQFSAHSISPEWIERDGKVQMAGEWQEIPRYFLDTKKPSLRSLRQGRLNVGGGFDVLAREFTDRGIVVDSGEELRRNLLRDLANYEEYYDSLA